VPLPTASVILWLAGLGWNAAQEYGAPLVQGPYILSSPDRLVTITPTPGPGYVWEAAADAGCFQARVRGPQNDQDGAESLAYLLDSLILGASFPAVISGHVISLVRRLGSTPSPLGPGPDSAQRYEYVTSYICIASN
jgi:Bacteriophage minor capsid protein